MNKPRTLGTLEDMMKDSTIHKTDGLRRCYVCNGRKPPEHVHLIVRYYNGNSRWTEHVCSTCLIERGQTT